MGHELKRSLASVSVALGNLKRAGMVTYARGRVEIVERTRLEKTACECYAALNEQRDEWMKESK